MSCEWKEAAWATSVWGYHDRTPAGLPCLSYHQLRFSVVASINLYDLFQMSCLSVILYAVERKLQRKIWISFLQYTKPILMILIANIIADFLIWRNKNNFGSSKVQLSVLVNYRNMNFDLMLQESVTVCSLDHQIGFWRKIRIKNLRHCLFWWCHRFYLRKRYIFLF